MKLFKIHILSILTTLIIIFSVCYINETAMNSDIKIENEDKISAFHCDMNRDNYVYGYVIEFKYDYETNNNQSYFILNTLDDSKYVVKGFYSTPTAEIIGNSYPLKTNLLRTPKDDLEKNDFIAIVFYDKKAEHSIITNPKDIIMIPYSASDDINKLVIENVNEMKILSDTIIKNFNSYDIVKVANNEDAIKAVINFKDFQNMSPNTDSHNRIYYSNESIIVKSNRIIYNTNTENDTPYLFFAVTISGISETSICEYIVDVSGEIKIIYEYNK